MALYGILSLTNQSSFCCCFWFYGNWYFCNGKLWRCWPKGILFALALSLLAAAAIGGLWICGPLVEAATGLFSLFIDNMPIFASNVNSIVCLAHHLLRFGLV